MDDLWECVVVGGGAAGLSAALTLGRARRLTLLVDAGEPSNQTAVGMGGLIGYDGRPPDDLYRKGREELGGYPSVEVRVGRVVGGIHRRSTFELEFDDGSHERARKVLLAIGMDYQFPDVPGVAGRWGRSVFHCPFCHAWELRDRPLGVLDRGAGGVERALLLRLWSEDVTLLTNGAAELESGVLDRLRRAGVTVEERVMSELRGPGSTLEAVAFTDGSERRCSGLLVAAPMHQRSSLAAQLGATLADPESSNQLLAVDPVFRTGVDGLYAAGDVGSHVPPSIATAIGAGSTAAKAIVHELLLETFPADAVTPTPDRSSR